jgi:hypothetical protein
VLPVSINLPASVESVQSLPTASHIVSPVFMLPGLSLPFSSKLTAGLLLLHQLHLLLCQVLVWDWFCPQHVCALDRELYCCLAVCPRYYHWSALFAMQSDFVSILNYILRNIRSKVHADTGCFIQFDGGAEFMTGPAFQVYRDWKLDISVNCSTHHWPVKVHKIILHAGAVVCLDSQFIYIWKCSVHNHSVYDHSIHNSSGLQHISVGTGRFELALMYYSELLSTVFFSRIRVFCACYGGSLYWVTVFFIFCNLWSNFSLS